LLVPQVSRHQVPGHPVPPLRDRGLFVTQSPGILFPGAGQLDPGVAVKDRGYTLGSARHWGQLLKIAFGKPPTHLPNYERNYAHYSSDSAVQILRCWNGAPSFHAWAQSLPPEETAKLFAILHE
jgi:hypothetical protein